MYALAKKKKKESRNKHDEYWKDPWLFQEDTAKYFMTNVSQSTNKTAAAEPV